MNDTLTYLISTYCSIGAFAFFVYILKQLLILIRYMIKYFAAEEKENT